jgi:hypothetical protein
MVMFSADAAQGASWMVKSKTLFKTTENKELIGRTATATIALLARLGLNEVTFSCTNVFLFNTDLEPFGAISQASKNARARFSGCFTMINSKVAAKCEPITFFEKGVIETEPLFGSLALHKSGTGVTVITPSLGTTLAKIHMGPACAIGEEVMLSGSLAVHDVTGATDQLESELTTHEIAEFSALTALKVSNPESISSATLDGRITIELSSGEVWSGLKE